MAVRWVGCGDASGSAMRATPGGGIAMPAPPIKRAPLALSRCLPRCPCPQVHKIGRFTVAQTRSLEQRLQKLQERAMVCETQREKTGLLAVRRGPRPSCSSCMQHLDARCAATPSIRTGATFPLAGWLAGWLPQGVCSLPALLLAPACCFVFPFLLCAACRTPKRLGTSSWPWRSE